MTADYFILDDYVWEIPRWAGPLYSTTLGRNSLATNRRCLNLMSDKLQFVAASGIFSTN